MIKKVNSLWSKISLVAGALFILILLMDKFFGFWGKGYEAIKATQKVPILEKRMDLVEDRLDILTVYMQNANLKLDALCRKGNIQVATRPLKKIRK